MILDPARNVHIVLPQAALSVIFDDCDRYQRDETGGRLIGTFKERGHNLTVSVSGIIESGPEAKRTAVSFFQDGGYQEDVFRRIERDHPQIEHLGNWHTHHVNGLATLSGGDVETYKRIVNHRNHNTSFFYALLVTGKGVESSGPRRYHVKHYIVRRGDDRVYEIPSSQVKIARGSLVWPLGVVTEEQPGRAAAKFGVLAERVYDRDILEEFYKGLKPYASKALGVYWRGTLELLDGSEVQVVISEDVSASTPSYSIAVRQPEKVIQEVAAKLAAREFASVRAAVLTAERWCNRALYDQQRVFQSSRST